MARVVVDVVMKPEILDPQGQAILGALGRLGITGVQSVRQGKHFEIDVDDSVDDEALHHMADTYKGWRGLLGLLRPGGL